MDRIAQKAATAGLVGAIGSLVLGVGWLASRGKQTAPINAFAAPLAQTASATQVLAASAFQPCAPEGGTCTFLGVAWVQYGTDTNQPRYTQTYATGSIICNQDSFGTDPAPGVTKSCFQQPLPQCASENGTCTLTQSSIVIFGAGTAFEAQQFAAGTITCSNAVFGGDPAYGAVKGCYVLPMVLS